MAYRGDMAMLLSQVEISEVEARKIRDDMFHGDLSSAKAALEKEPSLLNIPFIRNDLFHTFLSWACSSKHEHLEFVKSLVEKGTNLNFIPIKIIDPRVFDIPNTDRSASALLNAVYNGHINIVEYLLQHGANPNSYSSTIGNYTYPIQAAASKGYLEICLLLISYGANLQMKDDIPLICNNYGWMHPSLSNEEKEQHCAVIVAAIQ